MHSNQKGPASHEASDPLSSSAQNLSSTQLSKHTCLPGCGLVPYPAVLGWRAEQEEISP